MHRFRILPTDASYSSADIITSNTADVLATVQRLECKEADVLRDGEYFFSVRISENGAWSIFRRNPGEEGNVIP